MVPWLLPKGGGFMQVLYFFAVIFFGILGAAVFLRIIYCALVSLCRRRYTARKCVRIAEKPLSKERNDK